MNLRESGKVRRARRALDAAWKLLAEEGPEGLQMRAISAEAQISVRTLYNHFGSKGEVLGALMQDVLDQLTGDLEALATEDPIDRSRAIITGSIARFARDSSAMRSLLGAAYQSGSGLESHYGFQQARDLQEDALSRAMASRQLGTAVSARALAHQVLSAYNHAAARWARGSLDAAGFETLALHAWACLLLGFARGATRARLLEELKGLEAPMAQITDSAGEEPIRRLDGRASR